MTLRDQSTRSSDPRPIGAARVYVADASSNEILAFALDAVDGTLERLARLDFDTGVAPLTVAPDCRHMYAVLRGDRPGVASLALDPDTGRLTKRATTSVGSGFVFIHTDRSGSYLLGASYTDDFFAIHPIDAGGTALERPSQTVQTPRHAHCIVTDPSNRYVLVTSLGGDVILQYTFDAVSGRVSPNNPPFVQTPKGSGPRHLVFHPNGEIVYVNGELDGSIGVYRFDRTTGLLAEIGHVSMMASDVAVKPWAAEIAVTPDGRYLYASERRTSTLAIFDVCNANGLPLRRAIVGAEIQPRSFALDPSGRFAFVAGEKSHHLAVSAIDPQTGSLAPVARYALGAKPAWVSVVALPGQPPERPKPAATDVR